MSWVERRPEPSGLWIRWYPRRWSGVGSAWCDLARGTLGNIGSGDPDPLHLTSPPLPPAKVSDTLYLPPGRDELTTRETFAWAARQGVPLLVQRQLCAENKNWPPKQPFQGSLVWDPLSAVLQDDPTWTEQLPEGSHLVWPLVTGLTDDLEQFAELCRRFVERRLQTVQPLPLDLGPREKRWLWEHHAGDRLKYQALFHPEPTREGPFVDVALEHGLRVVVPRSVPARLSARQSRCFRASEHLALAAEELARKDGSPSRVQAFYGASVRVEQTRLDLDALARDGNLAFLDVPPAVVASLESWLKGSSAEKTGSEAARTRASNRLQ